MFNPSRQYGDMNVTPLNATAFKQGTNSYGAISMTGRVQASTQWRYL